jgi:hypothetical protein
MGPAAEKGQSRTFRNLGNLVRGPQAKTVPHGTPSEQKGNHNVNPTKAQARLETLPSRTVRNHPETRFRRSHHPPTAQITSLPGQAPRDRPPHHAPPDYSSSLLSFARTRTTFRPNPPRLRCFSSIPPPLNWENQEPPRITPAPPHAP